MPSGTASVGRSLGHDLEAVQGRGPLRLEDGGERAERRAVGPVDPFSPRLSAPHQAGLAEDPEVLADRSKGDLAPGRDLAGGLFALPAQLEDPLPGGGREDLEQAGHDNNLATTKMYRKGPAAPGLLPRRLS